MKKYLLTVILLPVMFCLVPPDAGAVEGSLKVASVFTDHLVLQRDTTVMVWGWADPGSKVTVKGSWGRKSVSHAAADTDGRWECYIETPEAGGPYSLSVAAGKEEIVLKDVMSGEVWLCTGQSNMEMFVSGFSGQPVEGGAEAVLDAPEYSEMIRVFNIKAAKEQEPLESVDAAWERTDSKVTSGISAVAYFFAKRLTKSLGVPVGIISSPWGGCRLEPWMSREWLDKSVRSGLSEAQYKAILDRREVDGKSPRQLATMYNSRMYPVKGYALRGFLWYQGCANLADNTFYNRLQAGMVECWRNMWKDRENRMPFYFVTIAPFAYGNDCDDVARAFFVENQLSSLDIIPNSGAAVTESLGDKGCIHPAKKQEVADQLALLALERTYNVKTGLGSGFPYPERIIFPSNSTLSPCMVRHSGFEVELLRGKEANGEIKIRFANTKAGVGHLSVFGAEVKGFEVAGPDRVFHPVKAVSNRYDVILDCSQIADPVAVRYAFHNCSDSDLTSTFGVPVPSFRTDNWSE